MRWVWHCEESDSFLGFEAKAGDEIYFVESPPSDNGICIRAVNTEAETVVDAFLLGDESKDTFHSIVNECDGSRVQ